MVRTATTISLACFDPLRRTPSRVTITLSVQRQERRKARCRRAPRPFSMRESGQGGGFPQQGIPAKRGHKGPPAGTLRAWRAENRCRARVLVQQIEQSTLVLPFTVRSSAPEWIWRVMTIWALVIPEGATGACSAAPPADSSWAGVVVRLPCHRRPTARRAPSTLELSQRIFAPEAPHLRDRIAPTATKGRCKEPYQKDPEKQTGMTPDRPTSPPHRDPVV